MKQSPLQYTSFRKRLDSFANELAGVEQGSVEAVHRVRVGSRRLREVIPLLPLDPETARKLNRRLRAVTRELGTVRELDVLTSLSDELRQYGRYSPAALTEIAAAVGRARHAAREQLNARLPTAKLQRLADSLEAAVKRVEVKARRPDGVDPARAWLWLLDARLARRAARVRLAIEAAGALYVSGYLHDVRIALKKLRYTAELSMEAARPRMAAGVAALKAAQDLLGHLHDLEGLLVWGRDLQASSSPPDLASWRELELLVRVVENDCRQLHARYVRDRARLISVAERMGPGGIDVAGGGRFWLVRRTTRNRRARLAQTHLAGGRQRVRRCNRSLAARVRRRRVRGGKAR